MGPCSTLVHSLRVLQRYYQLLLCAGKLVQAAGGSIRPQDCLSWVNCKHSLAVAPVQCLRRAAMLGQTGIHVPTASFSARCLKMLQVYTWGCRLADVSWRWMCPATSRLSELCQLQAFACFCFNAVVRQCLGKSG